MSACQSPDAVAPLVSMSEEPPAVSCLCKTARALPDGVKRTIMFFAVSPHPLARLLTAPQYDRWPNAFHEVPRLWNKAHLDALMFWRGGTEFGAPRDEDWTRNFNERFDEENRLREDREQEEAYEAWLYRDHPELR